MVDKITVSDLPGLQGHGQVATGWGPTYQEAIVGASGGLKAQVEGSKSDAIEAYLAKVNTLGDQIFAQYPKVLANYAKAVTTYANVLVGEGFSSKVKTDGGDISDLKTWLQTTSLTAILEDSGRLEAALQTAVDALNMDPYGQGLGKPDLTGLEEDAHSTLTSLAEDRQAKHDQLINAFNAFKAELESIIGEIVILQAAIVNARFMNSLPPKKVMGLIAEGKMGKEEVELLSLLKGSGDGNIVEVLVEQDTLSSEQFYSRLGEADTTDVSHSMMELIYGLIFRESTSEKGLKNVEHFLNGVSQQELSKAGAYLKGLVFAGDRLAIIKGSEATMLMPDFPKSGSHLEDYNAYWEKIKDPTFKTDMIARSQELEVMGRFTALLASAQGHDLGTVDYRGILIRKGVGNLQVTSEGYRWDLESFSFGSRQGGHLTTVKVNMYLSEDNRSISEAQEKLSELDKERVLAVKDFLINVGTLGAGPVVSFAVGVADELITGDGSVSTLIDKSDSLASDLSSSYKDKYSSKVRTVSAGLDLFEGLMKIDSKAQTIFDGTSQDMFDIGGYAYKSSPGYFSKRGGQYAMQYDLQAVLTAHDLDTNGLRAHIYRSHNPGTDVGEQAVKDFDDYMSDTNHDYKIIDGIEMANDPKLGRKVMDYLAGKGGKASNLGATYVSEGMDVITDQLPKEKKNRSKSYTFDFKRSAYVDHSAEFFERLVTVDEGGN